MKAIILAAGQGTRLRPLTNDRPKCMVEFRGKPIIDYIIETMHEADISEIHVVTGYKKEGLEKHLSKYSGVTFRYNSDYMKTNMLASLWCASNEFSDDIVISYSDIIYSVKNLNELLKSQSGISVAVDKDWLKLWSIRMDNPLDDAESLKLDADCNIQEIGKKAYSYNEIQGQYIGLIKISKNAWKNVIRFYSELQNSENMYMTDFLQLMINAGFIIKAVPIYGGWLEIDSTSDLKAYMSNKPFL